MWEDLRESRETGLGRDRPDLQSHRDSSRSVANRLWWFILLLIPFVNIIVLIMVLISSSHKKFGKGVGFAIGMLILPFIFFPMLAFSDAQILSLLASNDFLGPRSRRWPYVFANNATIFSRPR